MAFEIKKIIPSKFLILIDEYKNRIVEKKKKIEKIPLIQINKNQIFDIYGNKYTNNVLVELLKNIEKTKKINKKHYELLKKHYLKIYYSQEGKWSIPFIGYKKNIQFGITPWQNGPKRITKYYTSIKFCKDYLNRLVDINNSIKKGYNPKKGHISGILLINNTGRKIFIIYSGQRRMASLIHQNVNKINVELFIGFDKNKKIIKSIIKRKEVDKWENVKNKLFTKKEALSFFDHFFK